MNTLLLNLIQFLINFGKRVFKDFNENSLRDGYHSFAELYDFRKLYNAVLFNEWSNQGLYSVHKSIRHNDGELCFGGGWFIVVANLPAGQITNHYKLDSWELFNCKEEPKALFEFDGHVHADVIYRLSHLTLVQQVDEIP